MRWTMDEGRWSGQRAGARQLAGILLALVRIGIGTGNRAGGRCPLRSLLPTRPKSACLDRQDKHGPDWGKEPYETRETERRERATGWMWKGRQERMMELQMSSDSLSIYPSFSFLSPSLRVHVDDEDYYKQQQTLPQPLQESTRSYIQQPLFRNNTGEHTTELSGLTSPISTPP